MTDTKNKDALQDLVNYIERDNELDKESKKSFENVLQSITTGVEIDPVLLQRLISYLNSIFTREESDAIIAEDAGRIKELANLRLERNVLMTAILNSAMGESL